MVFKQLLGGEAYQYFGSLVKVLRTEQIYERRIKFSVQPANKLYGIVVALLLLFNGFAVHSIFNQLFFAFEFKGILLLLVGLIRRRSRLLCHKTN